MGVTLYLMGTYSQAYMVYNIANMEFLEISNKNPNKEGKVTSIT